MAGTQGTWGIGGFNLPDFGLTEALFGPQGGKTFNNPAVNNVMFPVSSQPTTGGGSSWGSTGGTTGQVAGTSTVNSGFSGSGTSTPVPNSGGGPVIPSYEEQMKGSINAGWDSYIGQLNDMLNIGLPGQRAGQEQIAQASADSAINQLGAQRDQSTQAVNKQQATSLKDLSDNVRNLFQSGNVYLGARGAGDSSAANQYSYAISKMGTKGRGDILTQANDRMNQIGDIYKSETNRIQSDLTSRMGQIADWFNQAQNQVRSQIGQAGLGRQKDIQALSQNIYNQALNAMQTLQTETANRKSQLEAWAQNNSKSVGELMQNMQQVQQMPAFQGIQASVPQVTAEGSMFVPTGYGANTQKKDLFGNPIG
jgi:hypothetical protein